MFLSLKISFPASCPRNQQNPNTIPANIKITARRSVDLAPVLPYNQPP
ncbi:MAG: hypothetical protein GQF41_3168 [Candidatus Rifleibacterium amylolyticum]|nr:MAG: hypothetical protein GQF41_3168 [Candidatus Rifleibacterium amylolyticum]